MLMPASSEFVALCRSQVALLTEGLGASVGVVYLTEELVEDVPTKLVPIVAYPDRHWETDVSLLPAGATSEPQIPQLPSTELARSLEARSQEQWREEETLSQQRQLVLPLMHESVVIGLLVIGREDRAWNDGERNQIELIADTIARACILDQRAQWLEQEGEQVQSLQAQQHEILDNLLHQFRNPLTALRTFGKLLVKRLLPTDRNRSIAESIVRESDRLQDLLQQFDLAIDIVEVEQEPVTVDFVNAPLPQKQLPLLPASNSLGNSELRLEPYTVREILSPLLNSAEAIAQERLLTLNADIPSHLPLVQVDANALREVLSNLIDNALKYTPSGGQIYLQARHPANSTQNLVSISISDNGPGIPAEDLAHIFERHYRGVQANSEIPGTGLGLAIAKDLVEKMGGVIQVFSPAVHSEIEGRGTTFTIGLPPSELTNRH